MQSEEKNNETRRRRRERKKLSTEIFSFEYVVDRVNVRCVF